MGNAFFKCKQYSWDRFKRSNKSTNLKFALSWSWSGPWQQFNALPFDLIFRQNRLFSFNFVKYFNIHVHYSYPSTVLTKIYHSIAIITLIYAVECDSNSKFMDIGRQKKNNINQRLMRRNTTMSIKGHNRNNSLRVR
jgi:hypothetical protein